ncbi:hypothetical protein [Lactiplantibacillus mudanjiangensis]|uniref:Uncharacterized protein n=1 Tax=Lactiplantibacillus mudanjiangensis TaxID=1296538 RepID=A0A660DZQ2_9LACO|nr:hypothetical protein [Lactiplantibacillus mudanjiangensis]VDG25831.1 hypothetical protein MUDAN_IGPPGNFN_01276 [Lactiplantibacillus mudanjiangensis]VDG28888.1 hypothetical protein MUDAN_MDHGFNIF_03289 [Lactiplantibacillus mudanjiangensis]
MKKYSVEQLVLELIGHINFFGDTNYDLDSVHNLDDLGTLLDLLLVEIADVAEFTKDKPEASAKVIHDQIINIKRDIQEILNDIK